MRDMPSRFIEILDTKDSPLRMSESDVRLEDVLADHEALGSRPRSSTQSSCKTTMDKDRLERDTASPAQQRWKRLSNILVATRRSS
ncbi:hypothetical protein HFD88_008887 [Aspergillus terreus]|jgi:hypothetical protein|nr:hypothetical protein HFD88_008887 [Aspergillus terreus]